MYRTILYVGKDANMDLVFVKVIFIIIVPGLKVPEQSPNLSFKVITILIGYTR